MNASVKGAYLSDLDALRTRAREQIMRGAVTPGFSEADRRAKFVSAEFLEHADEEQAHAGDLVDLLEDVPKD